MQRKVTEFDVAELGLELYLLFATGRRVAGFTGEKYPDLLAWTNKNSDEHWTQEWSIRKLRLMEYWLEVSWNANALYFFLRSPFESNTKSYVNKPSINKKHRRRPQVLLSEKINTNSWNFFPNNTRARWGLLLQVLQELILDSNDLVQFMQWSLADMPRCCCRTSPFLPRKRKKVSIEVGWITVQQYEFDCSLMNLQWIHSDIREFMLSPAGGLDDPWNPWMNCYLGTELWH